jgi:fumarate reductase subunit C
MGGYNYKKLMSERPTFYYAMTNSWGQKINFYEHPYLGDETFVIAVCHELELAQDTEFFDLDDMTSKTYDDYHVFFKNGEIIYGYEINK